MAKLLWVEDQSHWVDKFSKTLSETAFDGAKTELTLYRSAEAAKQHIALMQATDEPDLAILDARMNGYDQAGFSVSRSLKKKWPDLPVIFLSELSGTEVEEKAITESEAQDFIAKHQRNIEAVLCWRIKAAINRRAKRHKPLSKDVLRSGELEIDLSSWEVFWKNKKLMNPHNPRRPLAPTPRKILHCMVERSPRPLSTEQVADLLGADIERFSYANYRQHIKTLRMAFDSVESSDGAFSELCKKGLGIVTFGDARSYCWKTTAS